jgi:hypothetical protein
MVKAASSVPAPQAAVGSGPVAGRAEVNEVLVFDGALVVERHGTYLVRDAGEASGA